MHRFLVLAAGLAVGSGAPLASERTVPAAFATVVCSPFDAQAVRIQFADPTEQRLFYVTLWGQGLSAALKGRAEFALDGRMNMQGTGTVTVCQLASPSGAKHEAPCVTPTARVLIDAATGVQPGDRFQGVLSYRVETGAQRRVPFSVEIAPDGQAVCG